MPDEERLIGEPDAAESGDRGRIVFEDRTGTTTDGATIAETTPGVGGYDPEGMVRAVQKEISDSMGRFVLVVPGFSNLSNVLKFVSKLRQNEWLGANAIIVAFLSFSTNEWAFGITSSNNRAFWNSENGKRQLNASQIKIYSIEDYAEIIELTFDGRVSDAVTRMVS